MHMKALGPNKGDVTCESVIVVKFDENDEKLAVGDVGRNIIWMATVEFRQRTKYT